MTYKRPAHMHPDLTAERILYGPGVVLGQEGPVIVHLREELAETKALAADRLETLMVQQREILELRAEIAGGAHDSANYPSHVAWLCINNHNGQRAATIHLCDSDTPGAFKVYRAPPRSEFQVGREVQALRLIASQGVVTTPYPDAESGMRNFCLTCNYWSDVSKPMKHSPHCAYVIARDAFVPDSQSVACTKQEGK